MSDLYTCSKLCKLVLIMTFIGKKTLDGPVRLFVVFSCHASFNLFMTLTLLKIIIQLFWIWACLMSVPSWLGSGYLVFLSEIPPRPLHLLIFHFEIVVISHTFIRNNAERSQIPFAHLPLDVKSSLTIVNITTWKVVLIQSTLHAAFTSFTHTQCGCTYTCIFVQFVIYMGLCSQKKSRYRGPLMLPFYSHSQLPSSNLLAATNLISISRIEIDGVTEDNLLRLALFIQHNLQNNQAVVSTVVSFLLLSSIMV